MAGVLAVLLSAPPALGHAGAPVDAIDVQRDRTGPPGMAVEASVGLMWTEEDSGEWRWICHEAVTTADAIMTPRYAMAERTWLVYVRDLAQARETGAAVYRSTDGCDWGEVSGLDGREIEDLVLAPDGLEAWAVSRDEGGGNGVFLSLDGGASFEPTNLDGYAGVFTGIRRAEGEAGSVWVSSIADDGALWVHRTVDRGETWTSNALGAPAGAEDPELALVGAHPEDADVAWVRIDTTAEDWLLHTADGGQTFTEVLAPDGQIVDVEVAEDGAVWVGLNGQAWMLADDGRSFALVSAAPPGLGARVTGDEVWLATRYEMLLSSLALGSASAPEDGFDQVFSFLEVAGTLECPGGSHVAEICEPLWPVVATNMGIAGYGPDTGDSGWTGDDGGAEGDAGDSDSGPTAGGDDGPTCGCGGSAALLWPLLLLGAHRRRELTRPPTPPPSPPGSGSAPR